MHFHYRARIAIVLGKRLNIYLGDLSWNRFYQISINIKNSSSIYIESLLILKLILKLILNFNHY